MSDSLLWAEDIPRRWSVRRAKFLFRRQQRPLRSDDGVVTAFRDGQVTLRTKRREDGFTFAEKEIGYHGVRIGDLVIHAMDGFAGAIGVSESDGKCSPVCSVCTPLSGEIEVRYYASVLRHLALSGFISSLAKGIRERSTDFRFAEFKELALPVPPKEEQKAIVSFLARKIAAIDALSFNKERMIELLQEKRQALITQAVTKGLDANVPMKESGVEWCGQVPSHWELVRLRRVGRVEQGHAFAHDLQGRESGALPWFKVADMNRAGNEIDMVAANNYVDLSTATRNQVTILPPGAVIFPRVGAALLTNKRRVLSQRSIVDDNTYAIIPNARIRSRFLYLVLLLVDMAALCSPGLVPTVTFSAIKGILLALPSLSEQDRIIHRVGGACARLEALVQSTSRSVERLREYRQALITAAVTGKIDVSKEAA